MSGRISTSLDGGGWAAGRQTGAILPVLMSDLPFTPADPGLSRRLAACLDIEGKIPRALEALGPVAGRDVLLVDGDASRGSRTSPGAGARPLDGGRLAGQLTALGGRVRSIAASPSGTSFDATDGSVDAVIGCWSVFRAPSPAEVAEADRVLRPEGRLLVVHDYGRDDVSRLRGNLPEYGTWGRRDGWYLTHGFRVRVIHCFWTFDAMDEAAAFLSDAFGETGDQVAATLKRPRLSYNVAVYHRTRGGLKATA